LYGAETCTLRKVDQKFLESYGMVVLEKEEEDRLEPLREK
jgi:hypothetical protein